MESRKIICDKCEREYVIHHINQYRGFPLYVTVPGNMGKMFLKEVHVCVNCCPTEESFKDVQQKINDYQNTLEQYFADVFENNPLEL